MPFKVTPYIGFESSVVEVLTIAVNLDDDQADVNAFDEAVLAATNELPSDNVSNGQVIVTLRNAVQITSSLISIPAFRSGVGWGTGWTIIIIVNGTNTARIQGPGGDGGLGEGEFFGQPVRTFGGGGGGAGAVPGLGAYVEGLDGTTEAGGAAGTGIIVDFQFLQEAQPGEVGGTAIFADTDGPPIRLRPAVAATLEVFAGGGGGGGRAADPPGATAGDGGGPGLDGGDASTGGLGG